MAFIHTTKNLKLFRVTVFLLTPRLLPESYNFKITKYKKSALFGIQFYTQLPTKDKTALFKRSQKKSDSPTENPAFLSDSDF